VRAEIPLPLVPVDDVDVPLQVLDARVLLDCEREPDRAADLAHDLRPQVFLVLLERVLELLEALLAKGAVGGPVGLVERPAGGADGAVDVLGGRIGDGADALLGGRVDVLVRAAPARVDEFPVDQHAGFAVHVRHRALPASRGIGRAPGARGGKTLALTLTRTSASVHRRRRARR
jgi:hypothetical protein